VLDGFVVGGGPNPKGADVIDRHAGVDRDSKTADASVER
jgi:hypothetical protein